MSPYPKWRQEQCVHCAAGMPMSANTGMHWTGYSGPPACTAMEADLYIERLRERLRVCEEALRQARAAFTSQIELCETELGEQGRKRWSRVEPLGVIAELYARTAAVRVIDAALAEPPAGGGEGV